MKHTLLIFWLLWALGASGQIYIDSYRFGAAPAANLLLDDYPNAAAAYSLRKLRTAYTGNCIVVRRSSNNDTLAIGFSGNYLDTAALKTFCASTDCFIRVWYDQSTNGRNATQTTNGSQPRIATNGAMIYQSGSPTIVFDGTDDWLSFASVSLSSFNYQAFVGARNTSGLRIIGMSGGVNEYSLVLWSDNRYYFQGRATGYLASANTDTGTGRILLSGLFDGTSMSMYKNNSLISSNFVSLSLTITVNQIGRYATSFYMNGNLQEALIWATNQSSNRANIETAINSFYNVY